MDCDEMIEIKAFNTMERNKTEFDRETNCLDRVLKYVIR